MATYRVQLRYLDPENTPSRDQIYQATFQKLNVPLTKLTETSVGFYAVSDEASAVEKLTTKKAELIFRDIGLIPITPPELKARKSVFIRQLDPHAGSQSPKDITTEIEKQNKWLKIEETQKIKNYTHIIKVITQSTTMVDRLLAEGLTLFNTRVTPAQCEREHYFHILTCFKCYKYGDHPTFQCKEKLTLCSECGSDTHTHRSCSSSTKKCLNCSGPHRTLAASCPERKLFIKELKEKSPSLPSKTTEFSYAGVAQRAAKQALEQSALTPKPEIHIHQGMQTKIVALILEAHIACLGSKNSNFSEILSESLRLNYGIETKFPDRDSQAIFNLFIGHPSTIPSSPTVQTSTTISSPTPNPPTSISSLAPQTTPNESTLPVDTNQPESDLESDSESASDNEIIIQKQTQTPKKTTASRSSKRKPPSHYDTPTTAEHPVSPDDFLIKKTVTLYRSDSDPTKIKRHPSAEFIVQQLQLSKLGYKMETQGISPHRVFQALQREQFDLDLIEICTIPFKDFKKIPKLFTNTKK